MKEAYLKIFLHYLKISVRVPDSFWFGRKFLRVYYDICDDFVEIDYCGTLCILVCFKCKHCGKLDWGNADLLCDKCK